MAWQDLRGYAQAANDLSGIARARLTEAAREALRGEVERLGASLGLAGVQEVARLRRAVERLERRVAALEVATGTGSPADRPTRRAAEARSRSGAPRSTRPAGAGGPGRAGRPVVLPDLPGPGAEVPEAPGVPGAAAPAARTPVRRPRPAEAAAHEAGRTAPPAPAPQTPAPQTPAPPVVPDEDTAP